MPERTPILDEFKTTCRREFAYLVDEFGFTEEPLPRGKQRSSYSIELPGGKFINGFAVWFRKDSLRIIVEGVNWGLHANVVFETSDGQKVGFGHLAAKYLRESGRPCLSSTDQLEDVKRLAKTLRECCQPLLRGDRAALQEAIRIQHSAAADEAFRRKEYAQVIRLLSPHIDKLSPAEKRRLEFARKYVG